MRIIFQCQHAVDVMAVPDTRPVCPTCGNTNVAAISNVRAPRFVGTVTGPLAEYRALEPGMVNVATAGPLKLKPPKE